MKLEIAVLSFALWVCASGVSYQGRSCVLGQRLLQLSAKPTLLANRVRGMRFNSICIPFEKPECVKKCEWGLNCGVVAYRNNWVADANKAAYYIRGWNASVTFNGRFRNIVLQCCQSKSAVFKFCKASQRVGTNGFRFRTTDDPIVKSSADGQATDVVGMDIKIVKIANNQQLASLMDLCLVHKLDNCDEKERFKNNKAGKGRLHVFVDDVAGSSGIPPPLSPARGAGALGASVGSALGAGLGIGIPLLCIGCPDITFGDATGYTLGAITFQNTVVYSYSSGALGTTHPTGSTLTVSCDPANFFVGTATDNDDTPDFGPSQTFVCNADRRWYFNGQPVNLVFCLG